MLKAIETRYKGYRFRSRLEARWAVFFDALKVKWTYEEQGYDLGSAGWYLPDFRLTAPDGPIWFEIKPTAPSEQEALKAYELARQSKRMCIILSGTPGEEKIYMFSCMFDDKVDLLGPDVTDGYPVWCHLFILHSPSTCIPSAVCPLTHAAYLAARSARFEHGESGA